MNADTLLENFDVLAEAPNGIDRIRELVLSLGTRIGFGVDIQKSPKQKLTEVAHVSWGNLSLTKTSYVEDGQFLAISAAGPDGRIGHAEHEKFTPVISAIGARCGTMFMPDEKFTAIKNTMTVTPDKKKIDNWYLYYALKGSQLPRRGTAQPFLSKTDIENFEITVPSSLGEQQIIVAKVDELMALCEKLEQQQKRRDNLRIATRKSAIDAISTATTPEELEAAWKRINNNWEVIADTLESIDSLKTVILDLAVHGQLVEHDYSDHSAHELVAKSIELSKKKNVLDQGSNEQVPFEIPSNWAWSTIAGMCDTQTGTTPKILNSDNDREKIQYVTAADMVKQRALENNFISLDSARRSGRIAPKDSVLFVGIGTIGKSCLIESSATFNQQIHAATPRNINAKYLSMVLTSGYFQKICMDKTSATTIPILNKSKWEKIAVPIPPLSEQIRIVKKVDQLFDLCDQLESELKSRREVAEKFARSVVSAA